MNGDMTHPEFIPIAGASLDPRKALAEGSLFDHVVAVFDVANPMGVSPTLERMEES